MIPNNLTHREALEMIMKIARESTDFSRRMSACLEISMVALGLTESQRKDIQTKAMMRSEEYKENIKAIGTGEAKRQFKAECELDTGEKRQQYKNYVLRG